MAKNDKQVEIEELKAQIEAEVRAELEEKAAAERKELENKQKKQEDRMERELVKQENGIKAQLAAEKKVNIHIPENPLNPNEVVPVIYQGVIYSIPTGEDFEVPKSIYDTWKYAYDETRKANKRMENILKKEITIM